MPLLKHAKKKLRQDKQRTLKNKSVRSVYKSALKAAKENPSDENVKKAFSQIDKAAKHNIIHENKAARLKSSVSKVKASGGASKEAPKKKTATKKASSSKAKKPAKKK